jgi:hypothetical protein
MKQDMIVKIESQTEEVIERIELHESNWREKASADFREFKIGTAKFLNKRVAIPIFAIHLIVVALCIGLTR